MLGNTANQQTCKQICGQSQYSACDAEVSIQGREGKAAKMERLSERFITANVAMVQTGKVSRQALTKKT